jgi:hypothetical protein
MKLPGAAIGIALVTVATACTPSAEQEPATQESATAEAEIAESPLVGAWRITEFSFASPDTSFTISDPQPSLMIFLTSHYSQMYVPGDEPRELFSGDEPVLGAQEPTDAEVLTAFGSFIANSGTYEVSGSTIVTRPIVAKTPNFMAGGSLSYTYRLDGDTLWLTLNPPWDPSSENGFTLTRLE